MAETIRLPVAEVGELAARVFSDNKPSQLHVAHARTKIVTTFQWDEFHPYSVYQLLVKTHTLPNGNGPWTRAGDIECHMS